MTQARRYIDPPPLWGEDSQAGQGRARALRPRFPRTPALSALGRGRMATDFLSYTREP